MVLGTRPSVASAMIRGVFVRKLDNQHRVTIPKLIQTRMGGGRLEMWHSEELKCLRIASVEIIRQHLQDVLTIKQFDAHVRALTAEIEAAESYVVRNDDEQLKWRITIPYDLRPKVAAISGCRLVVCGLGDTLGLFQAQPNREQIAHMVLGAAEARSNMLNL